MGMFLSLSVFIATSAYSTCTSAHLPTLPLSPVLLYLFFCHSCRSLEAVKEPASAPVMMEDVIDKVFVPAGTFFVFHESTLWVGTFFNPNTIQARTCLTCLQRMD